MKVKEGVKLEGLKPPMRAVLIAAEKAYMGHVGREAIVTSTTEGVHSAGSLHPYGYAVDFRIAELRGFVQTDDRGPVYQYRWALTGVQLKLIKDYMDSYLGDEYQVIIEDDHIHVEWQKAIELIDKDELY